MDLPNIPQWNAGDEPDEESLNAISYALDFVLNPPEAHIRQSTGQTQGTGTTTPSPVIFQVEAIDNDGMVNIASDPTAITVNTPGWYELEYGVHWNARDDTTIRMMGIALNGESALANWIGYIDHVDKGASPLVRGTYDVFLNAGDYIQLVIAHGSSTSLTTATVGSANYQTYLRARWASL